MWKLSFFGVTIHSWYITITVHVSHNGKVTIDLFPHPTFSSLLPLPFPPLLLPFTDFEYGYSFL